MEIYTAQGDQREIFCPALEGNVVIAAPLVEQDKVVELTGYHREKALAWL